MTGLFLCPKKKGGMKMILAVLMTRAIISVVEKKVGTRVEKKD